MEGSFMVPAAPAEAELTVEKSRFIAHLLPVETEEEAKAFIGKIRSEYKDATHNVPAYVTGNDGSARWSSEDGEPSGTAGAPVLKLITAEGLTGTCIVITRYFGGIKLGTGGLVRAYTEVAKRALSKAGRKEIRPMACFTVRTGYKEFNRIKSVLEPAGVLFDNVEYAEGVTFDLLAEKKNSDEMLSSLKETAAGDVEILRESERLKSLVK